MHQTAIQFQQSNVFLNSSQEMYEVYAYDFLLWINIKTHACVICNSVFECFFLNNSTQKMIMHAIQLSALSKNFTWIIALKLKNEIFSGRHDIIWNSHLLLLKMYAYLNHCVGECLTQICIYPLTLWIYKL